MNENNKEKEIKNKNYKQGNIGKIKEKEKKKENNNKKEEIREFKYIYDSHILNNKKIKWEIKIEKISGWFSIGIGEIKKCQNERQDTEIIIDKKDSIKNKINFLLTNDHCIIFWKNDNLTYKKVKGSLSIKEGDNLTLIYSPKFGQLKVQKGHYSFTINEVNYLNNEWIVPIAIFSHRQDTVVFKNFQVLADYNNNFYQMND